MTPKPSELKLHSLSRRKKVLFVFVTNFVLLLLFLAAAEFIVRKKGGRSLQSSQPSLIINTPHGPISAGSTPGLYHAKHPTLGYITKPGEYTFTLPGPYSFTTTHLTTGLRITHPLSTYSGNNRREAWIFGCSFTQGWSLNDKETYAWLLQARFADYEVSNFGVDGYSTLQSLIQCREALQQGRRPAFAVLSYSPMHDVRNTQTRAWIKMRVNAGSAAAYGRVDLPYARFASDGKLRFGYVPLAHFANSLLLHSAFANFVDEKYNGWLEPTYRSHEVSLALIEEFSQLCKANGIIFVVAGITSDAQETLKQCENLGIITVDLAVDLGIPENTNAPYDSHPSALANQQYARKLEAFLCKQGIECKSATELDH